MGKIAFIYPGQGTQKTGMGIDFYEKGSLAKEVYEEASQAIGLDIRKLCLEGQELLKKTEYTQAALLTTMLAMTREIESRGIRPEVTAGLSLGEYAAITEGRGLTTTDAVRLVRERGLLMEKAVPAGEGAMCAVLGLEETRLEAALSSVEGVTVANYNCPGQIVITGKRKAVEAAAEVLKKAGARRTLFLEVSGPFHSPYMEEAGRRLEQKLREIPIQDLQIPYISNVTAGKEEVELIKSPVGMPGRAIANTLTKRLKTERIPPVGCTRCLKNCHPKSTPYCITEALIRAADGDIEEGLLFCGGNVAPVKKMEGVKEVIASLV